MNIKPDYLILGPTAPFLLPHKDIWVGGKDSYIAPGAREWTAYDVTYRPMNESERVKQGESMTISRATQALCGLWSPRPVSKPSPLKLPPDILQPVFDRVLQEAPLMAYSLRLVSRECSAMVLRKLPSLTTRCVSSLMVAILRNEETLAPQPVVSAQGLRAWLSGVEELCFDTELISDFYFDDKKVKALLQEKHLFSGLDKLLALAGDVRSLTVGPLRTKGTSKNRLFVIDQIIPRGWNQFFSSQSLQSLSLSGVDLDVQGLITLGQLTALKQLRLGVCRIERNCDLSYLLPLSKLEDFALRWPSGFEVRDSATFPQHFFRPICDMRLRYLNLHCRSQPIPFLGSGLTSSIMTMILHETTTDLEQLAEETTRGQSSFSSLTSLSAFGCSFGPNPGIFFRGMPKLSSLTLERCRGMPSPNSFSSILDDMPALRQLTLQLSEIADGHYDALESHGFKLRSGTFVRQ